MNFSRRPAISPRMAKAPLQTGCAVFFERIERYRQYAHRHSVDALLLYIYDDCNALAYYGVQPDGAKKTENLIALWQRAQGYAQSGDGSLYGFYRCWIPPPA